MCIERLNGSYIPMCDICNDTLENADNWDAARDDMKEAGWKRMKIDGIWMDVCPECQYDEAADGE